MSKSTAPTRLREQKPPPMVRLIFPKGQKLQPDGFSDLGVGKEVTVTIRGTVRELSDQPNREWDAGKETAIEMAACEFSLPGAATMADAIEKSRRRV